MRVPTDVIGVHVGVHDGVDRSGVEAGGGEPLHERPVLVRPEGEGEVLEVAHARIHQHRACAGPDHEGLDPQRDVAVGVGVVGHHPRVRGHGRGGGRGEEELGRDVGDLVLDDAGDRRVTDPPLLGLRAHRGLMTPEPTDGRGTMPARAPPTNAPVPLRRRARRVRGGGRRRHRGADAGGCAAPDHAPQHPLRPDRRHDPCRSPCDAGGRAGDRRARHAVHARHGERLAVLSVAHDDPARPVRAQHRRRDERRHQRWLRGRVPLRRGAFDGRDLAAPGGLPHRAHRQVPERLPEHGLRVVPAARMDDVGDARRRQPVQRVRVPPRRERPVRGPRLHAGRLRDIGVPPSRPSLHRASRRVPIGPSSSTSRCTRRTVRRRRHRATSTGSGAARCRVHPRSTSPTSGTSPAGCGPSR